MGSCIWYLSGEEWHLEISHESQLIDEMSVKCTKKQCGEMAKQMVHGWEHEKRCSHTIKLYKSMLIHWTNYSQMLAGS